MPRYIRLALAATILILASCTSEKPEKPTASSVEEAPEKSSGTADGESPAENPAENPAAERPAADQPVEEPVSAVVVLDSLYEETGDSEEALTLLEEAGVEDMDEDSRLVYAVLLRNEGRLDESREHLTALVEDNPSLAMAWFNLALVEHAAGNDDARDRALDETISADPSMAEAYAFRGNLAIADSDWDLAESSLKQSLRHDPENVESMVGLAWVYAVNDKLKDSLPLLDKAVELEPDFVYARVDRSRVNVTLKNYNVAEDDLDVAIELEPDVAWHYLDRARIRLRYFQDYDGALEDLEKVDELDPGNFFAMVYLAGLHDEERRFRISKDYYEKVVEARPDYVWAYMPMGKFAWMEGRFEDAAYWYAKAAAEDPDDFSFSMMAALSLTRVGQKNRGDKILKDLVRNYERSDVEYEVIRFCLERGTDYYAVNALNKEENVGLRERLWFYLGAIYESEGNEIGSQSVFERLESRRGAPEYDLAYAALHGMDG